MLPVPEILLPEGVGDEPPFTERGGQLQRAGSLFLSSFEDIFFIAFREGGREGGREGEGETSRAGSLPYVPGPGIEPLN